MFGFAHAEPFEPDQWLEQGDTVTVGEGQLSVLFTPGHTPGHIVFVDEQGRTAWVGDVLFNGGIGRTDFPKGDHATLINAIKNTLLPVGDDVTFIPGHGPTSTLGHERQTNPFLTSAF
jgi:glyoxylase-like metal-dependent hydrolase (beta-lactamase superfamily II)